MTRRDRVCINSAGRMRLDPFPLGPPTLPITLLSPFPAFPIFTFTSHLSLTMSRAKAASAAAPKASRPQATHPSWIEMIKVRRDPSC